MSICPYNYYTLYDKVSETEFWTFIELPYGCYTFQYSIFSNFEAPMIPPSIPSSILWLVCPQSNILGGSLQDLLSPPQRLIKAKSESSVASLCSATTIMSAPHDHDGMELKYVVVDEFHINDELEDKCWDNEWYITWMRILKLMITKMMIMKQVKIYKLYNNLGNGTK